MAGDWIKLETSTPDKPETHRIADLLNVNADEAVGILARFWIWVDRNSCNGHVTHVYAKPLESMMRCPGFVGAMVDVGWLELDEKTGLVKVPNYDRHNGSPAKSRALTKDRVKRSRNAESNDSVTLEALPEKRREEKRYKVKTIMSSSQANIDDARLLLQFLNDKAKRFFRPTAKTLQPILARLREGNSVSDCKAVIVRRCRIWLDDPEMVGYLRPDTLFNATKFAQYIGEVPPEESHANQAMP